MPTLRERLSGLFGAASSPAVTTRVVNDTHDRLTIDAGGRLTWGDGTAAGDVNLYRSAANTLRTDDTLHANAGVVTLAASGAPSATLADGALAVDTATNKLYFRSGAQWRDVTGVGAAVAVSDSIPAAPTANDLWFDSSTGTLAIFYDSTWVEVASAGPQGPPGPLGAFAAAIRSDQQDNYSYMGAAPEGSADAGAVWRITRILLTSPFTTTVAFDVAWTDRTTATYA